jgi:inward rectifier potassium channel
MTMPSPPQLGRRILDPDGTLNIVRAGVQRGYLSDFYHLLLVSSWRRLFALLLIVYLAANSLFALGYLLGGDGIDGAQPGSFADAFFFSVQTMATIGYGHWYPKTFWAHLLVTIESLIGLLGLALVTGLTFAKFSRPSARVLFSRVAVVTARDGAPVLMFRVANQRGNQIVEARMHVVLACDETTVEGEAVRRLYDLELARAQNALFALSWTAIHSITERSPLYQRTPESLAASGAEIIISLTGLDESFSQTVHARHSYMVDDIVWGARFVDILSLTPEGRRRIDFAHFHDIVRIDPAS